MALIYNLGCFPPDTADSAVPYMHDRRGGLVQNCYPKRTPDFVSIDGKWELTTDTKRFYNISRMASLRTALTNMTQLDIETNEALICHLRVEAQKRLAAAPKGTEDIVEACHYIFKILSLQDKICQDRHRISTLRK